MTAPSHTGDPEPEPTRTPSHVASGGPLAVPAPPDLLLETLGAPGVHDLKSPQLKSAVCAYVRTLKAAGLAPEQVLVAMKGAARQVGVPHYGVPEDIALVERLVGWCIEEYYKAD